MTETFLPFRVSGSMRSWFDRLTTSGFFSNPFAPSLTKGNLHCSGDPGVTLLSRHQMLRPKPQEPFRLGRIVPAPVPLAIAADFFHLRQITLDKLPRRRVHDRRRCANIESLMPFEISFERQAASARRVPDVDVAP